MPASENDIFKTHFSSHNHSGILRDSEILLTFLARIKPHLFVLRNNTVIEDGEIN